MQQILQQELDGSEFDPRLLEAGKSQGIEMMLGEARHLGETQDKHTKQDDQDEDTGGNSKSWLRSGPLMPPAVQENARLGSLFESIKSFAQEHGYNIVVTHSSKKTEHYWLQYHRSQYYRAWDTKAKQHPPKNPGQS